jgi:hypothetical protein
LLSDCGPSLLAVGGIGSVLAEVVAVEQGLAYALVVRDESKGVVGHFGYGLEDDGVMGSMVGVGAPAEGGVAVDEAGGDGEGVDIVLLEVVDDGEAGLVDVAAGDGFVVQGRGAGDGAVEVVCVGGAEGRDGESGLGEAGGELGVSVDDGADGGEFAVEQGVGVEVGGGLEVAVDDLAVEIGDDHVLGTELVVVDAGGLDDDEALLAVYSAGVTEGVKDEAAADEFEVGFEDGSAEFFEEHSRSLFA